MSFLGGLRIIQERRIFSFVQYRSIFDKNFRTFSYLSLVSISTIKKNPKTVLQEGLVVKTPKLFSQCFSIFSIKNLNNFFSLRKSFHCTNCAFGYRVKDFCKKNHGYIRSRSKRFGFVKSISTSIVPDKMVWISEYDHAEKVDFVYSSGCEFVICFKNFLN